MDAKLFAIHSRKNYTLAVKNKIKTSIGHWMDAAERHSAKPSLDMEAQGEARFGTAERDIA